MKLDSISKDQKFTGYYWLSNSDQPVILQDQTVSLAKYENANPFIQEAYFSNDKISYSIKHFDGKGHIVQEVLLSDLQNAEELSYLANKVLTRQRKDLIYRLKFKQEWVEREDELCENMKVLKPGRVAFIGFEEKTEEKKND